MDVSSTITFGFISIIMLLWYIWRKRRMTLFQRLGIPGPKPHLITGNVNTSVDVTNLSLHWKKKYGNIYGIYMGGWPILVVSDVELLKRIQIKDFMIFQQRTKLMSDLAIAHHISKEVVFSKWGDEWKNLRTSITPSFTTGKLKKMMPIITEVIDVFLEKIAERKEKTFDVVPLFRRLSFDINCQASFGITTGVQNNDDSKFIRSVYRSFDADTQDVLAAMLTYFPELDPLPQKLRIIRDKIRNAFNSPSVMTIVKVCNQIIRARKENPQATKPDLLQGLLEASQELSNNKEGRPSHVPLTEDEVLGNAFGFMVAGFDIIGLMLSFLVHHLVENPNVQKRMREEIKTHVKGKVEYDDLNNLTYLDQVLSEGLRMFPLSLIGISRTASEEFKYNGITIPKGMNISIAIHALNMDPDFWENPSDFNPDRFSPEKGEINSMVYQPFGMGPRNCIGMRFAQVVLKTVIASLFQKYEFYKPPDAKDFVLEETVFFSRPKNGVQIRAISI